jgi:hypothetical protein
MGIKIMSEDEKLKYFIAGISAGLGESVEDVCEEFAKRELKRFEKENE